MAGSPIQRFSRAARNGQVIGKKLGEAVFIRIQRVSAPHSRSILTRRQTGRCTFKVAAAEAGNCCLGHRDGSILNNRCPEGK
jgi:hypothetical protein